MAMESGVRTVVHGTHLFIGGMRSGKSRAAVATAKLLETAGAGVTFIATMRDDGADDEMTARIAAHRAARPSRWTTIETTDIAGVLPAVAPADVVVADCMGNWLGAIIDENPDVVAASIAAVVESVRSRRSTTDRPTILVTNEVGFAPVPLTPLGRRFVDLLGDLNKELAAISDGVHLFVAGRHLELREDR